MNVQDKLERILREMHIMLSRGMLYPEDEEFVLVHKKAMQKELTQLSHVVSEMLEAYEVTKESRHRAELDAKKHRAEIVRSANRQVEDIYAASVIYTDDALGRIQDIIEEAERATKRVLHEFTKEMEEEKRIVRSNQLELKTQLEDMKDTGKYMRIIEERNKEIEKAKAKKNEVKNGEGYQRKKSKRPADPDFVPITPDIKINEEYFKNAGLTPEGLPIEDAEDEVKLPEIAIEEVTAEDISGEAQGSAAQTSAEMYAHAEEPEIVYEKPEIKINEEYFRKAGIPLDSDKQNTEGTEEAENSQTDSEEFTEDGKPEETDTDELPESGMTPEEEAALQAELDAEYFAMQEGETVSKEERRGLLSFIRRDKS